MPTVRRTPSARLVPHGWLRRELKLKDLMTRESNGQNADKPIAIIPPHILRRKKDSIQRMIARRAYELFELRGRVPGHQVEDWAQAESELLYPCGISLKETAEAFFLRADLPGSFTPDQLRVSIETRQVMIDAEREISVICGHANKTHPRTRRLVLNESFERMSYRRMWMPPERRRLSWA